jgi:hypothetical protein
VCHVYCRVEPFTSFFDVMRLPSANTPRSSELQRATRLPRLIRIRKSVLSTKTRLKRIKQLTSPQRNPTLILNPSARVSSDYGPSVIIGTSEKAQFVPFCVDSNLFTNKFENACVLSKHMVTKLVEDKCESSLILQQYGELFAHENTCTCKLPAD